jgi:hypothetical protein
LILNRPKSFPIHLYPKIISSNGNLDGVEICSKNKRLKSFGIEIIEEVNLNLH